MRIFLTAAFFILGAAAFFVAPAFAGPETDFVITVKARDAKFVGSAAGGAQVIIRDRRTGDIIASGTTAGGTGDIDKIMVESRLRDAVLVDDNTAKLQFSLEIWEPIPVTISATGPLGQPQSVTTVSEDMILLPGKDYASGNGIMLELPGFAVDVVSPLPNQKFKLSPDIPVTIEANVMKMCGCLVADDTPWAPARYLVEVHIYKDGMFIMSSEIPYSGDPGIYALNLKVPLAGTYRLMVTAFDKQTKEAGLDVTTVILEE